MLEIIPYLVLGYWLLFVFVFGSCVGSLLNVCIYRLPLEKSLVWPGSRCGNCLQPIRWYDNIPLLSYWILRGRCRTCGIGFSMRYFLIELFTGLSFSGLFYLVVIQNIHQFDALKGEWQRMEHRFLPSLTAWLVFGHHALLLSFLIVATFCDFDRREIPLGLTVTGTILGLILAVLLPWPWPWLPREAAMPPGEWWQVAPNLGPKQGVYPWPVWGPLPEWLPPGSAWLGLATGVAGVLVGTGMLRVIRSVFSYGMGIEALGLGDADLMMMAGSFLGWQPVIAAFFIGVFFGLFFGIAQMVLYAENALAFGPSLSLGILAVMLGWAWIGPQFQPLLFNWWLVAIVSGLGCVLMLVSSYILRLMRL